MSNVLIIETKNFNAPSDSFYICAISRIKSVAIKMAKKHDAKVIVHEPANAAWGLNERWLVVKSK